MSDDQRDLADWGGPGQRTFEGVDRALDDDQEADVDDDE